MKFCSLPWISVVANLFHRPLALLGGVLLCLAPIAAAGQSVTFAGAQSTLPANSLFYPSALAVDAAGDVFIADGGNNRVVELPQTATGYGPQTTLPTSGLHYPAGVAVDSAGDIFITDQVNNRVVELPQTATGYGPQTTLPTRYLYDPWGIAVDSAEDVFIVDRDNQRVVELPKTATGYGRQVTLPASGLHYPQGIAVDSAEDVFIADTNNSRVVELPKTATGYGPQTTLLSISYPQGITVDRAGNIFITQSGVESVLELPLTANGYGLQTTLPTPTSLPGGIAVGSAGDVFITVVTIGEVTQTISELQTISVNFGGANVCTPGATTPAPCSQTLTLTFNVNAETTLGKPEVLTGGMTHQDFVRAAGSTCTGAVTGGSTCTVNVSFAPLAAGFRNGTVNITDSSGNVIASTPISGFGIAATTGPPVAQLSTTYMPFGAIVFGASETLPLMVANIGGGTLTVAPSITGHSYAINTAESTCAVGVTPGNSCTLVVQFSPTTIATHDDVLTLNTNGGDLTVDLAGKVHGLSVSGAPLQFGTVSSGSTEVLPLTVTNVGLPSTVTIGTAITAGATVIPGHSYTILTTAQNTCLAGIATGQSCTLPVEFAPTMSGNHDDLLTLTPSAGGGSTRVWLLGTTP